MYLIGLEDDSFKILSDFKSSFGDKYEDVSVQLFLNFLLTDTDLRFRFYKFSFIE